MTNIHSSSFVPIALTAGETAGSDTADGPLGGLFSGLRQFLGGGATDTPTGDETTPGTDAPTGDEATAGANPLTAWQDLFSNTQSNFSGLFNPTPNLLGTDAIGAQSPLFEVLGGIPGVKDALSQAGLAIDDDRLGLADATTISRADLDTALVHGLKLDESTTALLNTPLTTLLTQGALSEATDATNGVTDGAEGAPPGGGALGDAIQSIGNQVNAAADQVNTAANDIADTTQQTVDQTGGSLSGLLDAAGLGGLVSPGDLTSDPTLADLINGVSPGLITIGDGDADDTLNLLNLLVPDEQIREPIESVLSFLDSPFGGVLWGFAGTLLSPMLQLFDNVKDVFTDLTDGDFMGAFTDIISGPATMMNAFLNGYGDIDLSTLLSGFGVNIPDGLSGLDPQIELGGLLSGGTSALESLGLAGTLGDCDLLCSTVDLPGTGVGPIAALLDAFSGFDAGDTAATGASAASESITDLFGAV